MIADAIIAYLAADSAVAALVASRIHNGIAPPTATYPLIQFSQVGGRRVPVLDGRHGLKGSLMQFDSYASQGLAAEAGHIASDHVDAAQRVAAAVEEAMESFHGIVINGIEVAGCHLESERELLEDNGALARVSQDYEIWWRAA